MASNPPTIRPRNPSDLDDCVTILHAVHAKDQYPRVPNISYHDFLNSANIPFAWVAERAVTDLNECGGGVEEDEIIGHVAIGKAAETDLAVMVWRARQRGVGEGDGEVITATLARAALSSVPAAPSSSKSGPGFQPIANDGTSNHRSSDEKKNSDDRASDNIAILERLFVHPLARKSGAAAQLVTAAVEFAQQAGIAEQEKLGISTTRETPASDPPRPWLGADGKKGIRLLLFVLDANAAAKRLYERLGWEAYGRGVFQWGAGEEGKMGATCYASPLGSS